MYAHTGNKRLNISDHNVVVCPTFTGHSKQKKKNCQRSSSPEHFENMPYKTNCINSIHPTSQIKHHGCCKNKKIKK